MLPWVGKKLCAMKATARTFGIERRIALATFAFIVAIDSVVGELGKSFESDKRPGQFIRFLRGQKMGRFLRAQNEYDMKIGGEKKFSDMCVQMLKKVSVDPLSPHGHGIFRPLANDHHKLGQSIRFVPGL